MGRNVILFELNEVPFRILEEYCRWRPDSHFARRLPECSQHETIAADRGHLSPWITWPTVHRGVNNEMHGIKDFGQDLADVNRRYPAIWNILADSGIKTGVGGSLHSYPLPASLENFCFYLPDAFALGPESHPPELRTFQEFNLLMARASPRNVSSKIPWKSALDMLVSAPGLGLRPKTFGGIAWQLISERLNSARKARRRSYQSILAFDVYMRCVARTRPEFSTFFTNHVASSMHRFWAAAFPGDYEDFGYDPNWVSTFGSEIRWAMDQADAFFGTLLSFADRNPEYSIWMASSMGQAATKARPSTNQLYVTEPKVFMEAMGVASSEWEMKPSMMPRFNFQVSPSAADRFRENLERLEIAGKKVVFRPGNDGFFSVSFGQANLPEEIDFATLKGTRVPLVKMGLSRVEIEDKSGSTAYHIPEGHLAIYDPRDRSHKSRAQSLSTLDLAPALLRNFSVPVPSYMKDTPSLEAVAV